MSLFIVRCFLNSISNWKLNLKHQLIFNTFYMKLSILLWICSLISFIPAHLLVEPSNTQIIIVIITKIIWGLDALSVFSRRSQSYTLQWAAPVFHSRSWESRDFSRRFRSSNCDRYYCGSESTYTLLVPPVFFFFLLRLQTPFTRSLSLLHWLQPTSFQILA
jgi:hypothetical protein